MNNSDIKRMLSVGMTTMSDRLREYKDPFEPRERQLTLAPIEIDRRVRRQPCVVLDPEHDTPTDFRGTQ